MGCAGLAAEGGVEDCVVVPYRGSSTSKGPSEACVMAKAGSADWGDNEGACAGLIEAVAMGRELELKSSAGGL